MDDGRTEKGQDLVRQASGTTDRELREYDSKRQAYNNYDVIMALLAIGKVTPRVDFYDGYPKIEFWQSLWAEGGHGAGGSGEMLSRIGGLLGVDDILKPDDNKLKDRLYNKTLEVMKNGKLAEYISQKFPEIEKDDLSHGSKISSTLLLDNSNMTVKSIQAVFDKSPAAKE